MKLLRSIAKVIQAFSNLLQIEIAYFNKEGYLIAATEEYILHKGRRVHVPFFDQLHGNHITLLHRPGEMEMCKGCHFYQNCPSKAELIQDMMMNGKNYGYLSFVSLSNTNEKILVEKKDFYLEWLSRLKSIIISILQELDNAIISYPVFEQTPSTFIFGNSGSIMYIKKLVEQIRNSTSTVLITGETGTGKSMLAKYIHENSPISNGTFIEINCATIPESLFESELFGYEGGAFTNARKSGKKGYFELAHNGTLFLDEIGELPIHLQSKLLKVLQDGKVQRVGGTEVINVNVRIIAATNQSLSEAIHNKTFRSDLFYRLNVIPITIPALKERLEDLSLFADHFIEKLNKRTGKYIISYSDHFIDVLSKYHWPGNLRELENVLEYSMNFETNNYLTVDSLPPYLKQNQVLIEQQKKLRNNVSELEKEMIKEKLNVYGSDYKGKELVAKDLGISIRTLYRKLERLDFE